MSNPTPITREDMSWARYLLKDEIQAKDAEINRLLTQRDRLVKQLRDAGLSTPF